MPLDYPEFFTRQIAANTEAIAWAVGLVGVERFHRPPPELLGEWSAARHLFHLLYYEREVALPSLSLWFGAPYPDFTNYNENAAYATIPSEQVVLSELEGLRAKHLALIGEAHGALWSEERQTPWGRRTFYWVASKTLQHALEHTNNILKIALLWEHYQSRSRTRATNVDGREIGEME
ncbi:MAG: DinB family protein [Chloroflexota bacterium]|nr:DinB family protein [Chloroflexota bacterium]